MSVALDRSASASFAGVTPRLGLLATAGLTSLGAGAVHAAAIGVHAESRPAAIAFTVVATLQICWGGVALVRSGRLVAAAGVLLGVGAVAGWALAKTSGIGFIAGLDVAEPIQFADGLAAGMAAASAVCAGLSLRSRGPGSSLVPPFPMSILAVGVVAVSVAGMVSAGTHVHDHGTSAAGVVAGDGHDHDHAGAVTPPGGNGATTGTAPAAHEHESAVVAPKPYDPTKPIDLGGVPGVTLEEQAAAENIIAETLLRLPKWSDPATALASGFVSIGDGFTGTEHLVNQSFMDDDTILDPDKPESLVFDTSGGGRKLVAAMYMMKTGTPMDQVPTTGGKLMQWHIHNNLCFSAAGQVLALTDAKGNCAPPLIKPPNTPMIHVWLTPHPCGPFAALDGIGAGQIKPGETRLCDAAHGAH